MPSRNQKRVSQLRISSLVEPLEKRTLLSVAVNTFADEIAPADGHTSLREALALVSNLPGNQTIDVPAGTYALSLGALSINDVHGTVTVRAVGGTATLDAGGNSGVINVLTPGVLRGLTITGGRVTAGPGGAGVYAAADLTISSCVITNNSALQLNGVGILHTSGALGIFDTTVSNNTSGSASNGGGLYTADGLVLIANSTFSANVSEDGAGVFALAGNVAIRGSVFSNNQGRGAGIENNGAQLNVDSTTFSGNIAGGGARGGGIYNISGNAAVSRCTFNNNVARRGAGINVTGGNVSVTNSTFDTNNAGPGFGSAINQEGGSVTLVASTVARNESFGAALASAGNFSVGNSIVALNSSVLPPHDDPDDVSGAFTSLGYNFIGNGFGSTGFTAAGDQVGTAASPVDPLLGTLADNGGPTQTDALLAGSPAIDAGNPRLRLPTDQRGVTRPQGAAPDIGAYERQAPVRISLTTASLFPVFFDRRFVGVIAAGKISNLGPFGSATFTITDAKGNTLQKGNLDTSPHGNFIVLRLLPSSVNGSPLDLPLTLTILATNPDGNSTLSTVLNMPGQKQPNRS